MSLLSFLAGVDVGAAGAAAFFLGLAWFARRYMRRRGPAIAAEAEAIAAAVSNDELAEALTCFCGDPHCPYARPSSASS